MAVITREELENAQRDATDLGLVVNGAANLGGDGMVTTRTGGDVPTLRRVLQNVGLIYDDAAAGRAAVSDGDYYLAVGSTSSTAIDVWQRDSSSASTLISSYPSLDGVNEALVNLSERVVTMTNPVEAGLAIANNVVYYDPDSLSEVDEYISLIRTGGPGARSMEIVIAEVEGDGSLTLVSQTTFSTGTGATEEPVEVLKPAGCIYGARRLSGSWNYTNGAGKTIWFTAGVPTTSTAKSVSTVNIPNMSVTLQGRLLFKAERAYSQNAELVDEIGVLETEGWPDPIVNTGSTVPGGYGIILADMTTEARTVTAIKAGMVASASVNVLVVLMTGNVITDILSTTPVTLPAGSERVPVQIDKPEGYRIGFQGSSYKFQNSVNPTAERVWAKVGAFVEGETLAAPGSQHRFEVQLELQTGILKRLTTLEEAGTGDGTSELSETDNTGASDVTSSFASARGAHPFPYVRQGTFDTTAVPAGGEGLNGPGTVNVNDEQFFVPTAPRLGNLHDLGRAALMEHIARKNPLILCSDSRGHFAYAANGYDHWFNRLCRFLNLGVALDEPVMTALRPSSTYTPAFYGVTVSGGTTTSDGPLAEGLQLADGGYIEFTGLYEQVDVFAKQQAGAGTLSITFNGGSAYSSKSYSGSTALDVHSGFAATGQASSGTYRITAAGGAVILTGLVREAPLTTRTAVGKQRLRCIRAAHGSYTFGSFGASAITSQMAQAAHWGGVGVPIIDLGINDAFNNTPSGIASLVTAMIDRYEAANAPEIFGVLPPRPSSGWNATYGANRFYEEGIGEIHKIYRERGVHIIGVDGIAWRDSGGLNDGLHYGPGEPQRRKALAVLEGIIRAKGV